MILKAIFAAALAASPRRSTHHRFLSDFTLGPAGGGRLTRIAQNRV
jgi:hypothetical protein